jgi:hypothetical protein
VQKPKNGIRVNVRSSTSLYLLIRTKRASGPVFARRGPAVRLRRAMEQRAIGRGPGSHHFCEPGTCNPGDTLRPCRKGDLPTVQALVRRPQVREWKESRPYSALRFITALNPSVPFHIQYAERTARTAVFLFLCANPRRSTKRHS